MTSGDISSGEGTLQIMFPVCEGRLAGNSTRLESSKRVGGQNAVSQQLNTTSWSSSEQQGKVSVYESLKYALVLATSVILLTGLGEANGTSSCGGLLAWRVSRSMEA